MLREEWKEAKSETWAQALLSGYQRVEWIFYSKVREIVKICKPGISMLSSLLNIHRQAHLPNFHVYSITLLPINGY